MNAVERKAIVAATGANGRHGVAGKECTDV